jgi:hypothetical protein
MDSNTAFALGLITSALQTVFVMLSWILTSYLGRRTIYVWGSFINVCFLVALGIAGSVGKSNAANLAQASLGLIVSVGFTLGPAPASWVIIGETSAIRLRPLTTGVGRAAYYIVNIPCIFLATYMLNPTVRSHLMRERRRLTGHLGRRPWRQVRLRLGCDWICLLPRSMGLASRNEGPIVSRNRHPVQAQGPGSQVEAYGGRHQRRRVRGVQTVGRFLDHAGRQVARSRLVTNGVLSTCSRQVERHSIRVGYWADFAKIPLSTTYLHCVAQNLIWDSVLNL